MKPPYRGDAPTRSRSQHAGKIIDFQEEAKRRAIARAVASGECALCLVRYLMERYPLFFEEPDRAMVKGDRGQRRSFAGAQDDMGSAQDSIGSAQDDISASNDADASREGWR